MYGQAFHADGASIPPVCPFFRLATDPEARALSLGRERVCLARQNEPIAIDWQAAYCLDGFQECPRFQASRQARQQQAAEQLLHLLYGGHQEPPPPPRVPRPDVQPLVAATMQSRQHLPVWARRPAIAAAATLIAIAGFWAGLALATGGPGSIVRTGSQGAERPVRSAVSHAFTLTTERPTPTPTPLPLPMARPSLSASLSLSNAVRPQERTPTPPPAPAQAATAAHAVSPQEPPPAPPPAPAPQAPALAPQLPVSSVGDVAVGSDPAPSSDLTPTPLPNVTPEPSPTPVPPPEPTPTPIPSPTPDPWDAIPPAARVGQPVAPASLGTIVGGMRHVTVNGSEMLGPHRISVEGPFEGLPYHAAVLFGQGSGFERASLSVSAGDVIRRAVIVIEGSSNPGPVAPLLRFSVNGLTLWEGLSPFPYGGWGSVAWVIDDPALLIGSSLRVMLNQAGPGQPQQEPWVAITTVTVYYE